MRRLASLCVVTLLAVCLLAPAAHANNHSTMSPKVDKFIFLIDGSGSMGHNYKDTGVDKIVHAKRMMEKINQDIPELGYAGDLYELACFKSLSTLRIYETEPYGQDIAKIDDDIPFISSVTPLGEGLKDLDEALPNLKGRIAVILVSDGAHNAGDGPVGVAKMMAEKYEGRICFYTISFAEDAGEQKVLDQIAGVTDCAGTFDGPTLLTDDAARMNFVETVFIEKGTMPAPKDTDGDGVYDKDDECPGTPANVAVDVRGCPLDTDGDGVYDYLDRCAGTPMTHAVDADGCSIPLKMMVGILFATDSSTITNAYFPEVEKIAQQMLANPKTNVVIEGHTDSTGSDAYNKKLSERRAAAVKKMLVDAYDIDASRVQTVGYGETRPVASNETDAGRAKNRRVVAIFDDLYKQR